MYIESAKLNDQNYNHNWITYANIINGGALRRAMSDSPNMNKSLEEADKPFSVSKKS